MSLAQTTAAFTPTAQAEDLEPPEACAPFDPQESSTQRRLRILARLTDMAMDVAETIHQQAMAQKQLQDIGDRAGVRGEMKYVVTLAVRGDFGRAFDRISKSIRQNLILETAIEDGRLARLVAIARARAEARVRDAERAVQAAKTHVRERRERAERLIIEPVERFEGDPRRRGRLRGRIEDALRIDPRHQAPDLALGAQLAILCHDFGLTPDWSVWANEDWALEEARTGAPGSPYADKTGPP